MSTKITSYMRIGDEELYLLSLHVRVMLWDRVKQVVIRWEAGEFLLTPNDLKGGKISYVDYPESYKTIAQSICPLKFKVPTGTAHIRLIVETNNSKSANVDTDLPPANKPPQETQIL